MNLKLIWEAVVFFRALMAVVITSKGPAASILASIWPTSASDAGNCMERRKYPRCGTNCSKADRPMTTASTKAVATRVVIRYPAPMAMPWAAANQTVAAVVSPTFSWPDFTMVPRPGNRCHDDHRDARQVESATPGPPPVNVLTHHDQEWNRHTRMCPQLAAPFPWRSIPMAPERKGDGKLAKSRPRSRCQMRPHTLQHVVGNHDQAHHGPVTGYTCVQAGRVLGRRCHCYHRAAAPFICAIPPPGLQPARLLKKASALSGAFPAGDIDL